MGKFKIGDKKIEGSGIKKGQKQRSTQMVSFLFDFFEQKIEEGALSDAWDGLNEKEQWDVFIKCLKYMCPSMDEETEKTNSFGQLIRNIALRNKE